MQSNESQWEDISTAPRDGRAVLVKSSHLSNQYVGIARYMPTIYAGTVRSFAWVPLRAPDLNPTICVETGIQPDLWAPLPDWLDKEFNGAVSSEEMEQLIKLILKSIKTHCPEAEEAILKEVSYSRFVNL